MAFLAAAFLVAFFIEMILPKRKICNPYGSQRDSYIRLFAREVKKKIDSGTIRRRVRRETRVRNVFYTLVSEHATFVLDPVIVRVADDRSDSWLRIRCALKLDGHCWPLDRVAAHRMCDADNIEQRSAAPQLASGSSENAAMLQPCPSAIPRRAVASWYGVPYHGTARCRRRDLRYGDAGRRASR